MRRPLRPAHRRALVLRVLAGKLAVLGLAVLGWTLAVRLWALGIESVLDTNGVFLDWVLTEHFFRTGPHELRETLSGIGVASGAAALLGVAALGVLLWLLERWGMGAEEPRLEGGRDGPGRTVGPWEGLGLAAGTGLLGLGILWGVWLVGHGLVGRAGERLLWVGSVPLVAGLWAVFGRGGAARRWRGAVLGVLLVGLLVPTLEALRPGEPPRPRRGGWSQGPGSWVGSPEGGVPGVPAPLVALGAVLGLGLWHGRRAGAGRGDPGGDSPPRGAACASVTLAALAGWTAYVVLQEVTIVGVLDPVGFSSIPAPHAAALRDLEELRPGDPRLIAGRVLVLLRRGDLRAGLRRWRALPVGAREAVLEALPCVELQALLEEARLQVQGAPRRGRGWEPEDPAVFRRALRAAFAEDARGLHGAVSPGEAWLDLLDLIETHPEVPGPRILAWRLSLTEWLTDSVERARALPWSASRDRSERAEGPFEFFLQGRALLEPLLRDPDWEEWVAWALRVAPSHVGFAWERSSVREEWLRFFPPSPEPPPPPEGPWWVTYAPGVPGLHSGDAGTRTLEGLLERPPETAAELVDLWPELDPRGREGLHRPGADLSAWSGFTWQEWTDLLCEARRRRRDGPPSMETDTLAGLSAALRPREACSGSSSR